MKKLLFLVGFMPMVMSLFAGGLVTNTNQSAYWVRLPARDASTSIDAVYFNPAGLMLMDNGWHFSLSNQTIFQNKKVENFYSGPQEAFGLNESLFEGKVSAPLFPSIYGVYKMDRLAISFGFNPIGGGGGAEFDRGLPSFELGISDLVPSLASQGASAYDLNAFFEGTSIFFGYQGGLSYKINDLLSVYAGVRYVTAKNTYNGYLENVQLNMGGNWTPANAIFEGFATQATAASDNMQPLIDGGAGSFTFDEAVTAGIIDAQTQAALEGGLMAFGVDPAGLTLAQAQGAYDMLAVENGMRASVLSDQSVDVEQTGSGLSPILGVNISPSENLNIGLKYEFATKLELKNATSNDFTTGFNSEGTPITMFPDKATFRNDMPAMLSAGVDYKLSKFKFSAGMHYYFDKSANYGKKINGVYVNNEEVIDKNFMEFAGGIEYSLTNKLLVSAGYLFTNTGVNDNYQSDLSYSLNSSTLGFGFGLALSDAMMLNAGFGYTMYADDEVVLDHVFAPTGTVIPATESYYKDNLFLALGLDFSF